MFSFLALDKLYVYAALAVALVAAFGYMKYELNSAESALSEARLETQTLRTQAATDLAAAQVEARAAERAHALQTKESEVDHAKRLATLRSQVAVARTASPPAPGVRPTADQTPAPACSVPGLPVPAGELDGGPADSGLASRCAETTLQLIDLKAWVLKQARRK